MSRQPHEKNELRAAIIKEADSNNFVPHESLKKGITIEIPWSDLFMVGDHIIISLGINTFLYLQEEHIGKTIEHFVSADALLEVHGSHIILQYINVRIPGEKSPEAEYEFGAELYRAFVADVSEGRLPWHAVQNGFDVVIPAIPGATETDMVRLFMVGSYPPSSRIIEVAVDDASSSVRISIDKETSRLTSGGEVHIIYQVIRDSTILTSPSISFYSEAVVLAAKPVHVLIEEEYRAFTMGEVESGNGEFEFSISFDTSPSHGDEVFLLALSNSHRMNNAINHKVISEDTKHIELGLPIPLLSYMGDFKLVALLRNGSATYTSNPSHVFLPELT